MLLGVCLSAVRLSGWALAVSFGHLVKLSAASSSEGTRETLLLLQSSWYTTDENGSHVSSDQVLGWQTDSDPCLDMWNGVACACTSVIDSSCQEHAVISLNLSASFNDQKIYGIVPDIFDQLPELQILDLSDQSLHGALPQTIFGHPSLQTVMLRNNFFSGPLQARPLQPNPLSTLDVEFNMLSGGLGLELCNVERLLLKGNSLLCGSLPHCLRYMALNGAAGTSLDRGGGLAQPCTMPVASCDAAPGPFASVAGSDSTDPGQDLCKAVINKPAVGRMPITISFSSMTSVDVLVLEVTDFGSHSHRAWFWAQDQMFPVLLEPQAQAIVGSRLTVPHQISRPGGQTLRAIPPNALSVNVVDLPGDLLQASQLTFVVTAIRVLPESTGPGIARYSMPLGPHNTSVLQITTPHVPVHRKAPKILYASVEGFLASRIEVEVTWQVQHEYSVPETTVLLLYHAHGDWNAMVQSIANESIAYVFAASPVLNESTHSYTFRWKDLVDAARAPESDTRVLDSSSGSATSQASFADGQPSQNRWWQAQTSLPTNDGGFLVSSSFLLGHGMEEVFPPGTYMISIQVVDEHGIFGRSAIGPMILEDAIASHGTVLLAAYVFSAGIITSALVYWCIQRFLYGYMGKLLNQEPVRLALREVEGFFDELKAGMRTERAGVVDFSHDSEMCLVVSDMENSTLLSVESPAAFAASQEIHDALMMELIQRCSGVELMREGDSFRVAFKSSEQAIAFCLKVQLRLLEIPWPPNILAMKGCHEIYDEEGRLLFAGLRVRLGMYWAAEGSVVALFNEGACTYNIQGPGMDAAVAISDSAHGGQSVMTAEIWNRTQSQLPLAGFPIIERLGTYRYPDDRYSGDLYQLRGRVYRPLEREFPPLRGCLLDDASSFSVSKSAQAFNQELVSNSSQFNVSCDHANTGTTGPILVCCSVTTLTSQKGLDMDADVSHCLAQVCAHLEKRIEDYAKQWGGTNVNYRDKWMNINQSSPWVWILAFDELAGALRFVFSMQYGMLAEVWKTSDMRYFPPAERGPDGRILYQGPRITVAVHPANVSPGGKSTWKTNKSNSASLGSKKPSESGPTDTSSGRLSTRHDRFGSSSTKAASESAAASIPNEVWSQHRQKLLHSPCSSLNMQSLSGSRRWPTNSSPHQKNAQSTMNTNVCPDSDSGVISSDQVSVQPAAHAFDQPLPPSSDAYWQPADAQQRFKSASTAAQTCASVTQPTCKPRAFFPPDISQSSQPTRPSPSEHDGMCPHAFQQHRNSYSNPVNSIPAQARGRSCQLDEHQYMASQEHNKSLLDSAKPSVSQICTISKSINFLTMLATCGLLNPGQIVLTDSAFSFCQELQIGTFEVYDHGVLYFEEFDFKFGLKELLPARLHGRVVMALNTDVSGASKWQRGYHDAPSIDEPMCICFCKLHMPQAVRRAERLLLDLWARQKQSAGSDNASHEQMQAMPEDIAADADVARSSQGYNIMQHLPLPASFTLAQRCIHKGWMSEGDAAGGRLEAATVSPNESTFNRTQRHSFLQRYLPSTDEHAGQKQSQDVKASASHGEEWTGHCAEVPRARRGKGPTDSHASSTSNATLSHLVNVVNGAPGSCNATARSQADLLAYPHPAELLPTPQSVWSRKYMGDGSASLQAHERHMAGRLKELHKIKDTVQATVEQIPRTCFSDRKECDGGEVGDASTAGNSGLPTSDSDGPSNVARLASLQPLRNPQLKPESNETQSVIIGISRTALQRLRTSVSFQDSGLTVQQQPEESSVSSHDVFNRSPGRGTSALSENMIDPVGMGHVVPSQLVHATDVSSSSTHNVQGSATVDAVQSRISPALQQQARFDHTQTCSTVAYPSGASARTDRRFCSASSLPTQDLTFQTSIIGSCARMDRSLHLELPTETCADALATSSDMAVDITEESIGRDAIALSDTTASCTDDSQRLRVICGTMLELSQRNRGDSKPMKVLPSPLNSGFTQTEPTAQSRAKRRGGMYGFAHRQYWSRSVPSIATRFDDKNVSGKDAFKSKLDNSIEVHVEHTPETQIISEPANVIGSSQQNCSTSDEASIPSASADEVYAVISAFCLVVSWSVTVAMYSRVFLEVLGEHDGYLCKETDPGKFTVAFRSWNAGIVWASYLKQRLAMQHYPEDVIELPELAAKYSENGTLICRGVQPQIGCCYGKLQRKRPTAIGRADYYGVTANTAARIMSKAQPGQVLIGGVSLSSGSCEFGGEVHVVDFASSDVSTVPQQAGIVRLHPLGRHLLKGIRKPVTMFEVRPRLRPYGTRRRWRVGRKHLPPALGHGESTALHEVKLCRQRLHGHQPRTRKHLFRILNSLIGDRSKNKIIPLGHPALTSSASATHPEGRTVQISGLQAYLAACAALGCRATLVGSRRVCTESPFKTRCTE